MIEAFGVYILLFLMLHMNHLQDLNFPKNQEISHHTRFCYLTHILTCPASFGLRLHMKSSNEASGESAHIRRLALAFVARR